MSSTKVCCGCNIFVLTKGFTLFEIGMTFFCFLQTMSDFFGDKLKFSHSPDATLSQCVTVGAWISYLVLELHGLKNSKHVIIIIGCIIRTLKTFAVLLVMILVPFFMEKLLETGVLEGEHRDVLEIARKLIPLVELVLFFQLAYDTYRTYLQIRVAILTADGNQGENGNGEIFELPQYVDVGKMYKPKGSDVDPPPSFDSVVDPPPPYKV